MGRAHGDDARGRRRIAPGDVIVDDAAGGGDDERGTQRCTGDGRRVPRVVRHHDERAVTAAEDRLLVLELDEDLVADPERHLPPLCEFLGLEYDPAMLDYPQRAEAVIAGTVGETHHGNLRRAPTRTRDWRHDLSAREVERFEALAGDALGPDPAALPRFLEIYGERLLNHTQLYPGMRAAVEAARNGVDVAVVTKLHPVRSHSGAAEGGINVALGNVSEDDAEGTAKISGPAEAVASAPMAAPSSAAIDDA